jgi:hypothetical protein
MGNTPNPEDIGLMKMLPGMTVINTLHNKQKQLHLHLLIIMVQLTCVWTSSCPNFMPADEPFVIEKQL